MELNVEKFSCAIFLIVFFSTGIAFAAEPIMITISGDMNKVDFDGKWTSYGEWKQSSLNTLSYDDGTLIQLRTAHQDNFIYVFIDAVSMTSFVKNADSAIVCIDKNDIKPKIATTDDYCFLVVLNSKESFVLQGGSSVAVSGNFKKIPSPERFIGVSNISDENDHYSEIPHPSYEFRIPTDLVGRSDRYGFYVGVYDTNQNKMYSWPDGINSDSIFQIPSPTKWGDIISPDKTLPEFNWPIVALIVSFVLVLYTTKLRIK